MNEVMKNWFYLDKKNLTLSQVVITYYLRLLNLDEFVKLYFLSY